MEEKLSGFTLLKLIAAIQVIYVHMIIHFHLPQLPISNPPDLFVILSPFEGVPVFFTLSGYFLWKSLSKRPVSFCTYARRRFTRIFPELWIVVAFTVLAILILIRQELTPVPFLGWIAAQATFLQFWTPDCLRGFGVGCPNGSLWTITISLQFYLVIFFLHQVLHRKKIGPWFLVLLASALMNCGPKFLEPIVPEVLFDLYQQTVFPYLSVFLFAAFIAEFEGSIQRILKSKTVVLLLYILLVLGIPFDLQGAGYPLFRCMLIGLFAISFGGSLRFGLLKEDISYEIYLVNMPIVNILLELTQTQSWMTFLIAICLTFLLAFCLFQMNRQILSRLEYRAPEKTTV